MQRDAVPLRAGVLLHLRRARRLRAHLRCPAACWPPCALLRCSWNCVRKRPGHYAHAGYTATVQSMPPTYAFGVAKATNESASAVSQGRVECAVGICVCIMMVEKPLAPARAHSLPAHQQLATQQMRPQPQLSHQSDAASAWRADGHKSDMHALAGCGHSFCQECLQAYATGAVSAKMYPIRCVGTGCALGEALG